MVEIYDNAVSPEWQDKVESHLCQHKFPWYLGSGWDHGTVGGAGYTDYVKDNPMLKEYLQMVHTFITNKSVISPHSKLVVELFKHISKNIDLKWHTIYRIKANLQTQCSFSQTDFYNTPHIDDRNPHKVAIYYANDTDGPLRFFSKEGNKFTVIQEVEPKRGRLVVFDGNMWHAGRHPINAVKRIAINFNYI
jgi:hypothetical protein